MMLLGKVIFGTQQKSTDRLLEEQRLVRQNPCKFINTLLINIELE